MEPQEKRRGKAFRLLRKCLLGALLAFTAYTLLGFLALPPLIRYFLVKGISEHTQRHATVEAVTFNPYKLTLSLSGFRLGDRRDSEPMFSLDRLFADIHGSSILKGGLVVEDLRLERPHFRLIFRKDGSLNISDLMGVKAEERREGAKLFGVSIRNIDISEGIVDLSDEERGLTHQAKGLNIRVPFLSVFPGDTEKAMEHRLRATLNGASFDLWGEARPFRDPPDAKIHCTLEGIDLTRYISYLPSVKDGKLTSGLASVKGSLSYAPGEAGQGPLLVEGEISLSSLEIQGQQGGPLIRIPSLSLAVAPSDPLSGKIRVGKLHVESPEVRMARRADGTLNLPALIPASAGAPREVKEPAKKALALRLDDLRIRGGRLRFMDEAAGGGFETTLEKLDLAVSDFSLESRRKFPFDLSFVTEAGEEARLKGSIGLTPLSAEGELALKGIPFQKYRPYYEARIPFEIEGGVADLSARFFYHAPAGENPERVALSDVGVSLAGLNLKRKGDAAAFLALPHLSIGETSLDLPSKRLTIGRVSAEKGNLVVSRSREGKVSLLEIFPPRDQEGMQSQSRPGEGPGEEDWNVSLLKAELRECAIRFEDHAPSGGSVALTLEPIQLVLRDFSIAKGTQGKISLDMGVPAQGTLSAKGLLGVNPLDAKLHVNLKDLDIKTYEPYWGDRVNVTLERGSISLYGQLGLQRAEKEGVRASFQGEASLSDFSTTDRRNGEDLLRWKSLYLGRMELSNRPTRLSIDQVALTDFYSRIGIDEKGTFNLQGLLATREPPSREAPGPGEEAEEAPPMGKGLGGDVQVRMVTLQGGEINFSDRYIQPSFSARLTEIGGRVSGLSSAGASPADVRLSGSLNRRAPLEITGKINPLGPDKFVDLALQFRNIDLTPLSPYAGKYIGHTIEKGALSLELKYLVVKNRLDSRNKVLLDELTLGNMVDSPQATKLPVALAISLLKNRDGEIHLDLPVSGQINDPQFSIGSLVLKMLTNLLEKIVTAPFSMLASLFGGGEKLSHVEFAPGSSKIGAGGEENLGKLVRILYERPGIMLELEGHVDMKADEDALRNGFFMDRLKAQKQKRTLSEGGQKMPLQETEILPQEFERYLRMAYQVEEFPKPRGEWGGLKALPPEEIEKLMLNHIQVTEDDLRALAKARAETVRDHLLASGEVASGRLFVVEPKGLAPEKKENLPDSRVDFRLK